MGAKRLGFSIKHGDIFMTVTRTLSRELPNFVGKEVTIRGWLNNLRALGKVNFLILRDRLGLIQIVIQDKAELKKVDALQCGAILSITGTVSASAQAELGVEIINPTITVEVAINEVPPVEYYKPQITSDLEFILDNRAIAVRNREIQAVFKIQAEIAHAYRLYMHDKVGAVEYFPPNIIGASSEGGAEFFNVDYFGYTATLAQSSQLYKQIMVGVNERVFALAPFFRAENSNTVRHLTEGKQLEFEMGFFNTWHEVMDVEEGAIKFIMKHLHATCATEIALFGGNVIKAPEEVKFPRVTFAEAQEIYYKRTGIDERQEPDLSPASEKELCKYALEEFGTDLIFVTDWKTSKRPFYSFVNEKNPELTNTFDLLCGGTEITSGGQRRHTYESMVEGIKMKGMNPDNFGDYLSIFKHGMPPHGGFGLGLERLTMTILKLKNIREASLFPSDPKRIAGNRLKANIFFGEENVRNEILRQLNHKGFEYKHIKHDPTPTSEESAKVRLTKLEEGVKALILKGKTSKKNIQVNIPANMKLDMKAVADAAGEKFEFESPEVIKERYGIGVGGVPPFGNLLGLETYFDEKISKESKSAFNCGLQTESIVMGAKDLITMVDPKLGNFAKA
jgi:nondiscriminating aspartyl-tRNA synthetase